MSKIEKLTTEQEADIPCVRDKWIKIGLDTTPIRRADAKAAVIKAYECAGEAIPEFWFFTDGPLESMKILTLAALDRIKLTESELVAIANQGEMALTEYMRNEIEVYERELGKPMKAQVFWPSSYGQHEAGWLGFQDFFAKHFGLSEKSLGLRMVAAECGWIWTMKRMCIISAKPISIKMTDTGRLHNEKGPSVEYLDGTKVYSFNGVAIPEKWVMERETINPSEILKHSDVDKRAAGAALYGYARMKDKLDYKIIDGDPSTDVGALISLKLPGLDQPGHFLEAICPRNGPVFLGIPYTSPFDGGKTIDTAFKAQAFLARFPASAYLHPKLRT